jgi:hypothetical protein
VAPLDIAILSSVLPSPWLIIGIHERAHALVARKHTGEARVAMRIGVKVFYRAPDTWSRRLGLERTTILIGWWPSRGRCGHAHVTDREALRELYAAGTNATARASIVAAAPGLLLLGATSLLPTTVKQFAVCVPAVLLTFAVFAFLDFASNRIPCSPKCTKTRDGTDGYVLRRLSRSPMYLPEQQTAEELLREHGY